MGEDCVLLQDKYDLCTSAPRCIIEQHLCNLFMQVTRTYYRYSTQLILEYKGKSGSLPRALPVGKIVALYSGGSPKVPYQIHMTILSIGRPYSRA